MPRKPHRPAQPTIDKFVRETFKTCALPLIRDVLGMPEAVAYEPADTKIPLSFELIPDIWGKVLFEGGSRRWLHVEVQSYNDPNMDIRMLQYDALALPHDRLGAKQFLLYVGTDVCRMPDYFQNPTTTHRWELVNLHDFQPEQFLQEPLAEMSLLALFCVQKHWSSERKTEVIEQVLLSLKAKSQTDRHLKKMLRSAEFLANFVELQPVIVQLQNKMALRYNLETDVRYNQGIEKGIEKGKIEGIQEGIEKGKIEGIQEGIEKGIEKGIFLVAMNLYEAKIPIDQIKALTQMNDALWEEFLKKIS